MFHVEQCGEDTYLIFDDGRTVGGMSLNRDTAPAVIAALQNGSPNALAVDPATGEYQVTLDESQRQMLLMALHQLKGRRPGWAYAIGDIENRLGGQLDWPAEVGALLADIMACQQQGELYRRAVAGGRTIIVEPLLHGAAKLGIMAAGDDTGYMDVWEYADATAAVAAAVAWNPVLDAEPSDWTRHPKSGRRRPDGDPEKEHVDP